MTDGGEGHRDGDGSDGIEREHTEDGSPTTDGETWIDPPPENENEWQQSPPTDQTAAETPSSETGGEQEPQRDVSDREHDSTTSTDTQKGSELGEPTATKIARIRARESDLERGEITAYTTDRRSLDPSVQLQWGVWTGIISVILGLIAGAILGTFGVPPQFGTLIVGVFLVLGVLWIIMRYRVWVYQVREDSLYLERGVVTHVRTIVPYVRIQHVDTSRGPLERALGLSTLVVYTAGSRGADVSVPGLKPEEARDLQQRLKELAIEAEGDDAL